MTTRVKIRQMIEFEVDIDDHYGLEDVEYFHQRLTNGDSIEATEADSDVTYLYTEILEEKHLPNYVFDCNYQEELFSLVVDGEKVFSSRDHNEVAKKWGELTGNEVVFYSGVLPVEYRGKHAFLDYGDPDKCWDKLNGRVSVDAFTNKTISK